jgi:ATP-dependent protease HslVU (ClpYQ) peptidase subunit
MTCIVAVMEKEKVWMGADSAATDRTFSQSSRADQKMFKLSDDMLIGCCGSFRVRDLTRYRFPSLRFDPTQDDPAQFIVTDFVEALRETLKAGGCCTINDGTESFEGDMIVAFRGKLFVVYHDFQVEERTEHFTSIGSGSDIALGNLSATEGSKLSPRKRIEKALHASEQFNASVRSPFHYMSL